MIKKIILTFSFLFFSAFSYSQEAPKVPSSFNGIESYRDFRNQYNLSELTKIDSSQIEALKKDLRNNKTLSEEDKRAINFDLNDSQVNKNLKSFKAMDNTTLASMFANGKESFEAITSLAMYSCYVIGLFLVVNSILLFIKQSGDSRQDNGGMAKPLIFFFVGCSLFAFTSTVEIIKGSMALTGPGDILNPGGSGTGIPAIVNSVSAFLKMVGVIAVIRGWLFLVDYGNGKKDGTMGRGLTHLGGGVALMNIKTTVLILANTFTPQVSSYLQ